MRGPPLRAMEAERLDLEGEVSERSRAVHRHIPPACLATVQGDVGFGEYGR